MNGLHDLFGGVARLRKFVGPYAPNAGNILAGGGIGEGALAGELIALLSVLASTLAVTLASDHRGASAVAADVSGSKSNVQYSQAILDAFGLMLQPPSVHHDDSLRFANPARSLLDGLGWHTRHLSYPGEIPLPGGLGDGIKTRRVDRKST